MSVIDETHDPSRESWVASARGHTEFPIQNLPFGVFSPRGGLPRGGVAIGDAIFDLKAGLEAGLFSGDAARASEAAAGATLNPLMALGPAPRVALRKRLSALLSTDNPERAKIESPAARLLHDAADCTMRLPAAIGSYTDFFAGIHHARNGGMRRDPNNPLSPNYKYVPVAYHSRASSVRPSGVAIRRPSGQRKLPSEDAPSYGPCRKLDYELELAVWVGPGNALGEPIPIAKAGDHLFGLGLFNDWSARDIQQWESQPLGPFLGKSFGSTVSPWIVTTEALAPFRVAQPPRPAGDPRPLPHLWDDADQRDGAFDIALEALLMTEGLRAKGLPPHRMSESNTTDLYWTVAQMIAHHACNGCNLAPGDLFGSGTISGPTPEGYGSLMELSADGTRTITLASGETRTFVENGDEVIFRAHCRKPGRVPIGFGECRARIV
ncbi:MAG TPA: fumarylacetoacetase [Stellaceae bacterium]|jgi:fumarylacetoacetase|nr:fumarylacetoacetase [Stellaceae bacterium]